MDSIDDLESSSLIDTIASANAELSDIKIEYYKQTKEFEKALEISSELHLINAENSKSFRKKSMEGITTLLKETENNIAQSVYEEKMFELNQINTELLHQKALMLKAISDSKDEAKIREKFISVISHDIRAPIGNILQLFSYLEDLNLKKRKKRQLLKLLIQLKRLTPLLIILSVGLKMLLMVEKVSFILYIVMK